MRIRSLALILGLLSLAACSGASGGDTAGQKIYRHAMDQAPTNLDPTQSATVYANFLVLNAYDTLYAYKYLARPYQIKPNLAVGMPEISPDERTYTIRIKQGVHFIDDDAFEGGIGREVVASDFVYSMQRHFDPASRSQGAWLWQGRIEGLDEWKDAGSDYAQPVSGLQALDKYTIQIRLTRPFPQLVQTLTQGFSALVPREAVEKYGRELSIHPVGSGPFKIDSFNTARARLSRNPKFRTEPLDLAYEGYDEKLHGFTGISELAGRAPPYVDQVEVHFVTEDAARWNSFTKGNEVQTIKVPTDQLELILASKNPPVLSVDMEEQYHMLPFVAPEVIFNTFNMDFPDFGYNDDPQRNEQNHALRCAMIKGFNWAERSRRFYNDIAKIFPGIIPPAVPEYDASASISSTIMDVEGARSLLTENGWTAENLPTLTYGFASSVRQRQFFEQFRGFMRQIGYPQEKIIPKPYATFGDISRAWKQSELPLVAKSWGLDYPDAENVLQLFYGPNRSPGSNDANYANPQYDALYERSSVMQPGPERTAIYREMNTMLVDDCVAMMGLARTNLLMWHKNVVAYPDRNIVGGFFLRYVDVLTPAVEPN